MNLLNIFEQIEKADPEFNERINPRRAAIKNMAGFGTKVAMSALPLALGSLFQKAYGQTQPTDVNAILNFALTLEYLEAEFYTMGVATPGLIPAGTPDVAALTQIRDDENHHVAFLKSVLGTIAVAKPTFDFTAKGSFNPFSNYDVFLALAQAFEDTGVRAYKGQAPNLVGNKTVLGAALNIHSVEARHASHLRQMRRARGANQKPWITGKDPGGLPAAAQPIYNGEELDTQATVKITGIVANGVTISQSAATEAFDEPLAYGDVLTIAKLFITG
ncbi:ferritin-like domain-containing protein [Segetibacter koreensis]|uniref:ferritin-like domain-containing protein n=1 Tax=Segetibacter koreensis TaxID=398037 RepID=UPI00037C1E06|nr:ferritin-like domain-containing protein [Segetibacter koreensis]